MYTWKATRIPGKLLVSFVTWKLGKLWGYLENYKATWEAMWISGHLGAEKTSGSYAECW